MGGRSDPERFNALKVRPGGFRSHERVGGRGRQKAAYTAEAARWYRGSCESMDSWILDLTWFIAEKCPTVEAPTVSHIACHSVVIMMRTPVLAVGHNFTRGHLKKFGPNVGPLSI